MPRVVVFATSWGSRHGGINVFNVDFCAALAAEVDAQVVCVVFDASEDEVSRASKVNVQLLLTPRGSDDEFATEADGVVAAKALGDTTDVALWVGHDVVTACAALGAKKHSSNGRAAVIHHMDYGAYETMKGTDPAVVRAKELQQQELLGVADYVCAVGPKLTKSARDKLRKKGPRFEVLELRPGLYDIEPLPPSESFSAITFGRLNKKADAVKMGSLAAAAYGRAARENGLGTDPRLIVVGIDERPEAKEKERLETLVGGESKRKLPVLSLPFDTNRDQLLDHLREHSVAMVLSIHEGFGLTAWEAISAGVPLILTRNSGAYELIEQLLGGAGLGCISSVDVKGTPESSDPNPSDVDEVARELVRLGRDKHARDAAKRNALRLKADLAKLVSWNQTARIFAKRCALPLRHKPITIAVAGGHPDVEMFGASSSPRDQLSDAHRAARASCEKIAADIGQLLATLEDPHIHLNFTGVDGGSLGARIVRAYLEHAGPKNDVTTFFHGEFLTDEEAKEALKTKWPTHAEQHNVDLAQPYVFHPGQMLRFNSISLRRMRLIRASDVVLCLCGHFAVEELVDAAQLKGIPIVVIGSLGGMAGRMCAEIMSYNETLSLPETLVAAMKRLATAPMDPAAVVDAFRSVLAELQSRRD